MRRAKCVQQTTGKEEWQKRREKHSLRSTWPPSLARASVSSSCFCLCSRVNGTTAGCCVELGGQILAPGRNSVRAARRAHVQASDAAARASVQAAVQPVAVEQRAAAAAWLSKTVVKLTVSGGGSMPWVHSFQRCSGGFEDTVQESRVLDGGGGGRARGARTCETTWLGDASTEMF